MKPGQAARYLILCVTLGYFEAGLEKAYQDYCDGITPSDIAVSSLPLSDSANGQS